MLLPLTFPKPYIHIKHWDKDGNLKLDDYRESHSWVDNYYCLTSYFGGQCSMLTATGMNMTSYLGVSNNGAIPYRSSSKTPWFYSPGTNNRIGVSIGSGTGAESTASIDLGTIIAHGTSAGKLTYSSGSNSYILDGTIRKATHSRTFTNGGTGSVSVNECGLFGMTSPSNSYYLFNRDLLDATINVAPAETLYVAYIIALDFGA